MPDEPTKRKRQLTEFPEGWALGDPERETFRKYNPRASDVEIALRWEKFEAHHLSLGSKFKLWSQAWRTWSIRSAEFRKAYYQDTDNPPRAIGFAPNFGTSGMANLARHLGRGK